AGKAVEQRQLMRQARCGPGPVEALILKGLARRVARRVDRFVDSTHEEAVPAGPITLNEDQRGGGGQPGAALKPGGFQACLLHGVTGSGKTEIYLRAIEEVIAQGKEALVMVPEISLTPQTIQRFRGRCGEVAVLHSHLGHAERGGHWRRVAQGQAQVAVGARSAVFAPARRLGIIVIDEEHENAFKQESTPRYHARDVAMELVRLRGAILILGSATPSFEAIHAARSGRMKHLVLSQRVAGRPLPPVEIIDMNRENREVERYSYLSRALMRGIDQTLSRGEQTILFMNRRGFATVITCVRCGHTEKCEQCDISLTSHRGQRETGKGGSG